MRVNPAYCGRSFIQVMKIYLFSKSYMQFSEKHATKNRTDRAPLGFFPLGGIHALAVIATVMNSVASMLLGRKAGASIAARSVYVLGAGRRFASPDLVRIPAPVSYMVGVV